MRIRRKHTRVSDVYNRGDDNNYNEMRLYVIFYYYKNYMIACRRPHLLSSRTRGDGGGARKLHNICCNDIVQTFQRFRYYIARVNSKRRDNIIIKSHFHAI